MVPIRPWRKSLAWNANGCTRGRSRLPIPPTGGASRSPVPTRPTCSTRWTCCAITNCERAAPVRAVVRGGRLRVVGPVSRVLPAAEARKRIRDPGASDRLVLCADGRGHRGGAPTRRYSRDDAAHLAVVDLGFGPDLGQLGHLHLCGQQRPRGGRRARLL